MKVSDTADGDFEQAPVGTEVARCIKLIDIGTQEGEYQGSPTHRRQIIIQWELPNLLMSQGDNTGKPFVISRFYTASLGEKANLRKDLVNWRGREFTVEELTGFELKNILGKPCMLSITATDKGKSRVGAVMALPKGMAVPKSINSLFYFSLDEGEFNEEVFSTLSKGIKAMIEKSPEYKRLVGLIPKKEDYLPGGDFEDFKDDIPF